MKKIEQIKEIFVSLYDSDTDWSLAADAFINWCVDCDFKNKSFAEFVEWIEIDDEKINDVWHFFFGYGTNYEKFADDWVEEEERENYLKYCENR